ncbi:MAG: response regulator, partial [Candidatus Obscuribacterales bacterium]|nr:response regulator [Candidatus Obscuribacterales bacterium]
REIASMEETKKLTKQLADERMLQLSALADRLRALNEASSNTLGQLPKILQAVVSDKNFGVMVVAADGKVLLFNSVIQNVLGLQLGEKSDSAKDAAFAFYRDDKVSLIPSGSLPWDQVQEERSQKLFVQHPRVPGGVWVQVHCVPLVDDTNAKAGAVAIVNDITEQVKIEEEVQRICDSLEQQLSVIENAKSELLQLASRLGNPEWANSGEAEDVAALESSKGSESASSNENKTKEIATIQETELIKTLLVVDDLPVNRKLIGIQLQKLGYEVEQAEDGKQAVEMVIAKEYGLVFMDLDMPIMDGFQATAAIRKHDLETRQHTPIVAMTSYDREGDREQCLSSGMDEYLPKGMTKKKLDEVINRLIRTRIKLVPVAVTEESQLDESDVVLDLKQLGETYGKHETIEIMELFVGTTKTLIGCLKFAIEEQDVKSVNHFAYSFKGPCSTLGLDTMVKLTEGLIADAARGNWTRAQKEMALLEKQCQQIMQQWNNAQSADQKSLVKKGAENV